MEYIGNIGLWRRNFIQTRACSKAPVTWDEFGGVFFRAIRFLKPFGAISCEFEAPHLVFSGSRQMRSRESIESMGWGAASPTKYWNILVLFWPSKYWKNIWHLLADP